MAMSAADAAVCLDDPIPGKVETVETRWGPITVTISGDQGRTPCLTLHEAGLNHRSCFQGLLLASGPKSLLMKNFCLYQVDAPGCQAPSAEVPASFLPLTLDKLTQCLADVAKHYRLREVLGLGVGAGGQVLVQLAAEDPALMSGLILISPSCQRPGWWEWGWGGVACRQLWYQGWAPRVKQYFVQRLFGELMQQALGGESDLLQAFRRECDQLPPRAAYHYLRAALDRRDCRELVRKVRCRLLLVYGGEALHKEDCVELATRAAKERFAVLEVPQAGLLCSEEKPQEVVGVVQSFLVALQLEGYGLGPGLVVGE